MKTIVMLLLAFAAASSFAATGEVSGTVTLAKGVQATPEAVLFIFAKKAGAAAGSGMPVAVLRVPQPKFPYKFSLTETNVMAPGTPFEGPFSVYARLSPTGDAMDKSGPQGTTANPAKPVNLGAKDLKIELKK